MTNILKNGAAFLSEKRNESMAEAIVYRRGSMPGGVEIPINAALGRTQYETINPDGIGVDTESTDFIIRAADLDLGEGPVEPDEGDQIDWVKGATTYTYILRRDGSEKAWRYSDDFKIDIRIHTKLKGTS